MKTVRELDLRGRRVLVRVDFNVPMQDGVITDDLRVRTVLPTIEYLLGQGARLILCSHRGRPRGQRQEEFSLAPVAVHLEKILDRPVRLAPDCVGEAVRSLAQGLEDGDVLLLENLRFHAGEQANDPGFARELASLAEVYVNDAFAVSHRAHASVVGVPALLDEKGAGFLLTRELETFHRSVEDPVRPLVAIVGGAKVSSKLGALTNMLAKVDALLIGGAMANTFLRSQGYELGASRIEEDLLEEAAQLLEQARERGVRVHLPVDVVAADRFAPDAMTRQVTVQDIPKDWLALDVGPATVICFREVLADARTIVWNGPVGAFEMDLFAGGTMGLAHAVADAHALSITGGGDSNAAVRKFGLADRISYMSTGGGAFLMLMEGRALPGVTVLDED